jgi:serine/threonine protein kinase
MPDAASDDAKRMASESSPLKLQVQIDRVCEEFLQARSGGEQPWIEDFLERLPHIARPLLLRELIREDVEQRRGMGEVVEAEQYFARFPDDWSAVEQAFGHHESSAVFPNRDSSLTIDTFCARLAQSELLSAADTKSLLANIPETERPADGESFAALLVRQNKLTRFQAKRLCEGAGDNLTLGNYVILDQLGRGGMGAVFKAEHRQMKRVVALKVIRPDLLTSPNASKRFQREVETAARLDHPNIVAAFDADEVNGTCFLVMELVDGCDLATAVQRNGAMPVENAIDAVLQAARGLAFAHKQGIVHRDVKPSNLLVDGAGAVKILDLGLATLATRDAGGHETLTGSDVIVGTVDYMAPEQAENPRLADERSDIYSLGLTLWFLLTGRIAYDDDSDIDKLLAHRERLVPSLVDAQPTIPLELDVIFQRMVAKAPADRFPTMNNVVATLETFRKTHCDSSFPTRPWGSIKRTVPGNGADFLVGQPAGNAVMAEKAELELTGARTASLLAPQAATTRSSNGVASIVSVGQGAMTRARRPSRGTLVSLAGIACVIPLISIGVWQFAKSLNSKRLWPNPAVHRGGDNQESANASLTSEESGQITAAAAPIDIQRSVAAMVAKHGGRLYVHRADAGRYSEPIASLEDIPEEPFVAGVVDLGNRPAVTDEGTSAMRGLPFLEGLYLANTNIGDQAVRHFQAIDGLLDLNLTGTKVTDESVRIIASHLNPVVVALANTAVTDRACIELRKMPRLRRIDLARTSTDAGLRELAGHRAIQMLYLGGNPNVTVQGISHLRSLPSLQILPLDGTGIGDEIVEVLPRLPLLRYVDLRATKVTNEGALLLQKAIPYAIVRHPAVPRSEAESRAAQWVLDQKGIVRSGDGNILSNVPKDFFTVGAVIFPWKDGPTSGAKHLAGLRHILDLNWPNLHDADAETDFIAGLDTLLNLVLPNADLSDAGLKRLTSLTQLEGLDIAGATAISDEGLEYLAAFEHLRYLNANSLHVGNEGLAAIGRMANLNHLNIGRCKTLTSEGLRHLTTLRILRILVLNDTAFDDSGVTHLAQMGSLRLLRIENTRITDSGVAQLRQALPKCAIFWDDGFLVPGDTQSTSDITPSR